jgi:alkanesulfonate monooxygenase
MIPIYAPERLEYSTVARIKEFARRAEDLGFASLWVPDHMVNAPGMFDHSCLSPLLTLAYAAAVTERVSLGTSVLILSIRHPVITAKDIATLDALSGGRCIIGVGTGWNPHAFQAAGANLVDRGARTDEALDVVRRLLIEAKVSHRGRHWSFADVTVTPRPMAPPPVWVAGGAEPGRQISLSVIARIAQADGWIARARASNAMIKSDWQQIQAKCAMIGRDPAALTFAHLNFLHLVPTGDRGKALAQQKGRFLAAMGTRRSWEQLQEAHLTGTPKEIVGRIRDLADAGLQHMILCPLDYDLEQLELYASQIVSAFDAPQQR